MAIQKALFTTGADFDSPLLIGGKAIDPYLYFDGVNLPNDVGYIPGTVAERIEWSNGTPTPGEGVIGKGIRFNAESLVWQNFNFPKPIVYSISMWVKMDSISGWKIFATNRGEGWPDYGLHMANYNGQLNIRAYGTGGSIDLYSTDAGMSGFEFKAGQWYHVAVVWDKDNGDYDLQGFVNGERVVWGNLAFAMNDFQQSLSIGDMNNSYPFNGNIDEVLVGMNEKAFTQEDIPEYYDKVKNGTILDSEMMEGSLQLGKGIDGKYPTTPVSWISRTVDLGGTGRFVDFGYMEAVGQIPEGTSLDFYSRTSANNETWSKWLPVNEDGTFASKNQRYNQIRVDFTGNGTSTPILEEVRIMEEKIEIDLPESLVRSNDPLYLYNDLESGLDSLGEIANAYDLILEEEINGEELLTFKVPYRDKKRKEIGGEPVEMVASIARRYFVVKEILDKRDNDGNSYSEFITEARWTELRDWYVDGIEVVEVTAETALKTIIANVFLEPGDPLIDWKIGNVEITKRRTLRSDWDDVLTLVRKVQNTWGGEVLFDTETKTIHLLQRVGKDTGIRFTYDKNMKSIERRIDTYDLITRIYPTGAGELDIRTVNKGVNYIENREWVDKLGLRRKIIPYRWKDERYTIPQNLYDDGKATLDELAKPNIAYETTVVDLSALTGHLHESFELGDMVVVEDTELFDEEVAHRIVRRSQNIRQPEFTDVELSQPTKTLASIQSRAVDEQVQDLIGSDLVSNSDVRQMTVFNQLLNSRADDGMTSWVHEADGSTFELSNAGFSGSWSYKVTPDYNKQAKMTQTVEGVSHRTNYTVSASVATEGALTRGSSDDAFAGIKVLVYYEGEAEPEVHYLAIPDVTTKGEQ